MNWRWHLCKKNLLKGIYFVTCESPCIILLIILWRFCIRSSLMCLKGLLILKLLIDVQNNRVWNLLNFLKIHIQKEKHSEFFDSSSIITNVISYHYYIFISWFFSESKIISNLENLFLIRNKKIPNIKN